MAAELEAKHPNSKVSSVGQFTTNLQRKDEINNGNKNRVQRFTSSHKTSTSA